MKMTAFGRQFEAERNSSNTVVGMLAARLLGIGRYRSAGERLGASMIDATSAGRAPKVGRRTRRLGHDLKRVGRPSRRIRQSWTRALKRMGREEVRYALDTTNTLLISGAERVVFVDTGLTNGADRYPTRTFVQNWLGESLGEEEQNQWRIRLVVVFGFAATLALVLGVAGG